MNMRHLKLTLIYILATTFYLACESNSNQQAQDDSTPLSSELDMELYERDTSVEQMTNDQNVEEPNEVVPQGRLITGVIGRGHWDGVGEEVRFDGMVCATISADRSHLLISDAFSGTIRDVDIESQAVSTLAGFPYEFAVFNGPLDQARFESPRGCGLAPNDEGLLVADSATLRWLDLLESNVTTLTGVPGELGNRDGLPSEARLGYLTHDVVWAPSGEYALISDRSNDRVRLFIKNSQTLHALAPLMEGERELRLDGPGGLAMTENGDLLIADTFNSRLIQVNLSLLNIESQIANQNDSEVSELSFEAFDAQVITDNLSDPQGVATANGKAWLAGFNGEISEVDLESGVVAPFILDLSRNKEPELGGAFAPLIYDDSRSVLYYMDINSESIREINVETGVIKTLVGPKTASGDRDGPLDIARFSILYDVIGTAQGWFVTDPSNGKVKQVVNSADEALVTTVISASDTARGLRLPRHREVGEAPVALAYNASQNLIYIADVREHVIRSYHLETGAVEVLVGSVNESGDEDGLGTEARLNEPFGLDFGEDGLLYIADAGNGAIRSYNPSTNELSTVARGAIAPYDVLLHNGDLYVVNGETPVVFKVLEQGFEVAFGNIEESGPGDGENGRFATPSALNRYDEQHILVVDSENHRIRTVNTNTGELGTWVGQFTRHGAIGIREPLPWNELRLQSPNALARYGSESMILSDTAMLLLEGDPWAGENAE